MSAAINKTGKFAVHDLKGVKQAAAVVAAPAPSKETVRTGAVRATKEQGARIEVATHIAGTLIHSFTLALHYSLLQKQKPSLLNSIMHVTHSPELRSDSSIASAPAGRGR